MIATSSAIFFAIAAGCTTSTAASTIAARSTGRTLDAQLAGDDARDFEQILDQPRLDARVALDALERACLGCRLHVRRPQHARPPEHGVERRAQLV